MDSDRKSEIKISTRNVILPWEQQIYEGETDRNYQMFCVYRDLGQQRTLSEASEKICPPDPENPRKNKIVGYVAACCKKFRWRERASMWDNEIDRKLRNQEVQEIKKMRERHVSVASQLLSKALQRLSTIQLDDLGPTQLLNFIIEAIRIEREARGVKDIVQVEHVQADPGEQSIAQEETPENLQLILATLARIGAIPETAMGLLNGYGDQSKADDEAIQDSEVVDVEIIREQSISEESDES
jgi:hypothetical protein